jgi:hypothetical protein
MARGQSYLTQAQFLRSAISLAKPLDCTREEALKNICEFAIARGMDLDERDLQRWLGEPAARGRISGEAHWNLDGHVDVCRFADSQELGNAGVQSRSSSSGFEMNSKHIWEFELPVDGEQETPLFQKQIQEAINSLVKCGLVAPTGKLRKGRDGKLYPVYAADIDAKPYTTASAILEKKKRRIS